MREHWVKDLFLPMAQGKEEGFQESQLLADLGLSL